MKKLLFCAAVAALATACTQDEYLMDNQASSNAKGLVFDVTLAENAQTRGELTEVNKTYPFFWYAEQDRINVWAYNAKAGTLNTDPKGDVTTVATTGDGKWTLPTNAASYKATKSEGVGQFTAASDADMLTLNATPAKATIVATYGDIKATTVKSKLDKKNNVVPGEFTELVVTTSGNASNSQSVLPNEVKAPMVSTSVAEKEHSYDALGEKANLKMVRILPLLKFSTLNAGEYLTSFGKLNTVSIEAKGYDAKAGDGALGSDPADVAASKLAYDTGKTFTVVGATPGFAAGYEVAGTPGKVEVTVGQVLKAKDAIYANIAPVDRKKAGFTADKKETLEVVYTFANITFKENLASSANWSAKLANGEPNAVTPVPALDLSKYDYLVVENNGLGGGAKTLLILKGNLKNALDKTKKNVKWNGADVAATAFTKIESNVVLTDEELGYINTEFTSVVELNLKENTTVGTKLNGLADLTTINLPKVTKIDSKAFNASTSLTTINLPSATEIADNAFDATQSIVTLNLPEVTTFGKNVFNTTGSALTTLKLPKVTAIKANTFNAQVAGSITTLELPVVTTIDATGNVAFSKLTDLNVNSYAFAEDNAYKMFFNTSTQSTLANLKAEAIESFRPTFGYDRALSFQDYKALVTVALNPKGVALTAAAFKGCTSLTTVTGVVDIANAPGAFENDAAITEPINVANTIIPNQAFKGATTQKVMCNGKQIVPTEIGTEAFMSNIGIKRIDLSQATKIGASAFEGATSFVGASADNNYVVTIVAKTINEKILNDTKVVRVQFTEATKLGANFLKSVTSTPNQELKQIKFLKNIKAADVNGNAFAALKTEDLDLFVATTQEGVDGLKCFGKTWKSVTREDTVFTK